MKRPHLEESSERDTRGGGGASRGIGVLQQLTTLRDRLEARGYAASTIEQYTSLLHAFDEFLHLQDVDDLRAVRPADIEAYKAKLMRRKLSPSTRAQSLQAVGRLFDDLIERGLLLLNPTASVQRLSRKEMPPRRVPTPKQMRLLFDAIDTTKRTGVRDRAILEVLYGCALRIGELCDLVITDIDLTGRQLRVRHGKGDRERVVPLTATAREWLSEYLRSVRPRWAKHAPTERALWLTQSATTTAPGNVRQTLLYLCNKTKLKRIGPHAIRHAAATHMMARGADIRHVQELLGHQSLTTTQLYTRVAPRDVKLTHDRTHPREQEPEAEPEP